MIIDIIFLYYYIYNYAIKQSKKNKIYIFRYKFKILDPFNRKMNIFTIISSKFEKIIVNCFSVFFLIDKYKCFSNFAKNCIKI